MRRKKLIEATAFAMAAANSNDPLVGDLQLAMSDAIDLLLTNSEFVDGAGIASRDVLEKAHEFVGTRSFDEQVRTIFVAGALRGAAAAIAVTERQE